MANIYQPPGEETKPLAIVGGGYAGTVTLIHTILKALEDPKIDNEHPLRITQIERQPQQLRGGVAYGNVTGFDHKLNLSSKRITPFMRGKPPEGIPTFDEYIDQRAVEEPSMVENFANPNRRLYGQYLDHVVDLVMQKAGGRVKVDTHFGEVVDIEDHKKGDVLLKFADGSELDAMHAVLAVGNKDAAKPRFVFNIVADPNYLDSAYSSRANSYFERISRNSTEKSSALIIGTGLSAMDNAMRLLEGGYKGKIVMTSRHGDMHPVYSAQGIPLRGLLKGEPRPESELPFMKEEPKFVAAIDRVDSFDSLFKRMQAEFRQLLKQGYTGEEIVNHWERYNHKVYERFPEETVKYLTAHKTELNIMRVGTVPEVFGRLQQAVAAGQLTIMAGDINDIKQAGKKFKATITPNLLHEGTPLGKPQTVTFTEVLNGIGFDNHYDLKIGSINDPLWRSLQAKKGFLPHRAGAGVELTEDFTLVNGDGKPYKNVSLVGVPAAGHMSITPYPYPEKEGEGTRIAAFSLNIQGILGGVLAMIEQKFEKFRDMQQSPDINSPHVHRTRRVAPKVPA